MIVILIVTVKWHQIWMNNNEEVWIDNWWEICDDYNVIILILYYIILLFVPSHYFRVDILNHGIDFCLIFVFSPFQPSRVHSAMTFAFLTIPFANFPRSFNVLILFDTDSYTWDIIPGWKRITLYPASFAITLTCVTYSTIVILYYWVMAITEPPFVIEWNSISKTGWMEDTMTWIVPSHISHSWVPWLHSGYTGSKSKGTDQLASRHPSGHYTLNKCIWFEVL